MTVPGQSAGNNPQENKFIVHHHMNIFLIYFLQNTSIFISTRQDTLSIRINQTIDPKLATSKLKVKEEINI